MRIIAISRILDEADIVEAFVRHTSAYVQHHIFLDNGSTDGTIDILRKLKEHGFRLSVYQNKSVSFNEQAFMTFMYDKAVEDHGAEWVACLDCDEFIDDRRVPGGLSKALSDVRADVPAIKVPWHQYRYTRADDHDEKIVPLRMVRRLPKCHSSKVMVRGKTAGNSVIIDNGGHELFLDGVIPVNYAFLEEGFLAHYSERNAIQSVVKFMRGWAKAKAADYDTRARGISIHYKAPFETLRDRPQDLLRNEWFMNYKGEADDLVIDQIEYKGEPLQFTSNFDVAMLAVRSLSGYMEALADAHAALVDAIPAAKELVELRSQQHERII